VVGLVTRGYCCVVPGCPEAANWLTRCAFRGPYCAVADVSVPRNTSLPAVYHICVVYVIWLYAYVIRNVSHPAQEQGVLISDPNVLYSALTGGFSGHSGGKLHRWLRGVQRVLVAQN
jgi:hypothetical protein